MERLDHLDLLASPAQILPGLRARGATLFAMLLSASRGRPNEFGGALLYASLIRRSVSWSETKDGE